ncbi:adenine phosphoribosyltransferase [Candidatus Woesearchaeota archaeon CG07_land_8_20_14_0_80_44_23]|nr:MAG: adenine phosphoribosyltransferase [Candidatus Woesearchaeota archaeon CG07_land_8_20_14_0_80_44_23]
MRKSELKNFIRDIPDFPKQGILFRDITPLLQNAGAFKYAISKMLSFARKQGAECVVSAESRGFIFGSVLAYKLKVPFVPVRKPGKLPYKKITKEFTTEYSTDAFEMHEDAIKPGQKVLIVDDLLATGGTVAATAELVERLGGKVCGFDFLIELRELKGRKSLKAEVYSIIKY